MAARASWLVRGQPARGAYHDITTAPNRATMPATRNAVTNVPTQAATAYLAPRSLRIIITEAMQGTNRVRPIRRLGTALGSARC